MKALVMRVFLRGIEMALKDLAVRNAKSKDRAYKMSDGAGLYLYVSPTGGKLWRWNYRFDGKGKTMALGKYPDVPLTAARIRHADGRSLLATGVDPMIQRKATKSEEKIALESAFANIAQKWLKHWEYGKSSRHVDSTKRRIATNILPFLGDKLVTEITAPNLVAMVKAIQDRGARDIAKRALETTGQIFRFAVAHGYVDRNPAADIRPADVLQKAFKTNYARIDAKELPHLLRQIKVYPGRHVTRIAIQLLALTFVRTGELIAAKWSEFDIESARWDIPAERMKMRTSHIVPLSKQTLDSLTELHTLTGSSEWLFPGEGRHNTHMSNNTILKGLERMGYKGMMTGHGFRGLASTILHEQDYPHDHIELQLAHTQRNAVSAAYNHALYLKPRAKMMQDWADFLEEELRGAKILQMPAREA
jgi:integrase